MRSGTVKGGGSVDCGPLTLTFGIEVVVFIAAALVDEEEETLCL